MESYPCQKHDTEIKNLRDDVRELHENFKGLDAYRETWIEFGILLKQNTETMKEVSANLNELNKSVINTNNKVDRTTDDLQNTNSKVSSLEKRILEDAESTKIDTKVWIRELIEKNLFALIILLYLIFEYYQGK